MKKKILIIVILIFYNVKAQTNSYKIVDSLFKKGRYQLALKQLNNYKLNYKTHYKKGEIYASIDNYKNAIEQFEKALVFEENYQLKIELANLYQKVKNYSNAIGIYEDVLTKDSLNLVLKYKLGKLYLKSQRVKKGLQIFKHFVQKDSLNANYWYYLGNAYALSGDRNRKINSFLQTYKKDSLHLNAIVKLAASFNSLKDRDSTQIFVEKGLLIDNSQIALLKLKVNQLYREKNYVESIPYLLKLDTISSKDSYPISMLGKVYYNLKDYDKAKKYFKILSKRDFENFKSYTYLGHIAMEQKQFTIARLYYQIATVSNKKKRDEEYFGLANALYELEKPTEAIENYKKALSENYKNDKALYRLATLSDDYFKDKKIAYKHYKKYIDRFSEKDSINTKLVEKRMGEIKKILFLKGENLK